jgi:hypothetical protein
MRFLRLAATACLALLLVACAATGPKFAEVEASLPVLRTGEGRIILFRENSGVGAAVRPEIRLNGMAVGSLQPGSFLFVDRPAGRYTASARTEAEATVEFELGDGETAYVSMRIQMGLFVGRPQLTVHPAVSGAAALASLAYVGSIPLVPGVVNPVTAGAVRGGTRQAPQAPQQPARQGPVTMDDLRGLLPATQETQR